MRNYIIISKEQAEKIRGRHGKYSALEPVEFPDGMFGIPERVINDPEYDDIKDTLKQYQKECKVQDIEDLDEEKGKNIEKDKYYLSKDYWVVKSLKAESFKADSKVRLTALKDTFAIKQDIATLVDAEKDAKEPLTPKMLTLFNYSKPVTNFRGEKVGRWSLVKDLLKELWRRIKNLF
jgi:hypothetical protein